MKKLYLLRHAKSDWRNPALTDHQRPLNTRGIRAAALTGQWLDQYPSEIDTILCSTAVRTRQTLDIIQQHTDLNAPVEYTDLLYEANMDQLLDIIHRNTRMQNNLMLIGHNPGLETLLQYLLDRPVEPSRSGKCFTTANLAVIQTAQPYFRSHQCQLLQLFRPRNIKKPG